MIIRTRSLLRDMLVIALVFGCAYFLFYDIHIERRWKRTFAAVATFNFVSSAEDKERREDIKIIWFAGMTKGGQQESSWVNALPKVFATRYPKARIFVVLQQRPEVSGEKIGLDVPLNIAELKRLYNEWVYESIASISEVQSLKPDVLFLRNAYKIIDRVAHQAPWLVDPSVVRVIYPVHNHHGLEFADTIVSSDSFLKPLPSWQVNLSEEAIKKRPPTPVLNSSSRPGPQFPFVKDDIIFIPASLYAKKGQLTVAKLIDPKLLLKHNLTLVFAGKVYNQTYWDEVQSVLKAKGIKYEFLGFVKDRREMFDWYARSRGLIHYVQDGPGPRVVYEALYANTPFFVSPKVTLDARILPFGVRVNGESEDPVKEFNSKFEALLTTQWGDRLLLFARKHLTESAFNSLFDRIECLHAIKKRERQATDGDTTSISVSSDS